MELNYKEFGQGAPIIILHGLFGTLDNWQTVAKQLAEEHSVYILDQRNHGRSPHLDRLDYKLMAEDLQQFMEANWIHQASIIGHSMGGKTAMQFAQDFPDMVQKLIVVDIAPKAYKGGHQQIFEALFALDLSIVDSRKAADQFLETRIPDFGVRQFLLKNLTRSKDGGYRWKMNLPVIFENYSKILAPIELEEAADMPTLFIRGGKSDYIQEDDLSLLQSYFPNASLKTVEKAGHWVHAEAPVELIEIVKGFLAT